MSDHVDPSAAKTLAPPEERFWQRYSPHGEAAYSFGGSFTLHALVGGMLLLIASATAAALAKTAKSDMKIEPVRLKLEGGSGGNKLGSGDGPGIGGAQPGEEGAEDDITIPGLNPTAPKLPDLNPADETKINEQFAPEDARMIVKSNNEQARAMAKLGQDLRKQIAPRPGKGEGGGGQGGGKGDGKDKGKDNGKGDGDGKATLTQRERRMLRWHMRFTANTGTEYVSQLRDLGAILAFPVGDDYKIVRDLRPPAKLETEDLSKIQRIYWIDDKQKSVDDVLFALKLQVPGRPGRFVAFMPEDLEKRLFEMERSYVVNVLRKPFDEERIGETTFRVVFKGGRFQPELQQVSLR